MKKYHTWDEALAVYQNAWDEGTIRVTPIPGGPFDTPRARLPMHPITIDSDSDEGEPDGSGDNADSDVEDFRLLFQSLHVWFVRSLLTFLIHQLISTCIDCWERKRAVDLDFAATSLVV